MARSDQPNVERINEIVSKQIDRLALILVSLQNDIDQGRP